MPNTIAPDFPLDYHVTTATLKNDLQLFVSRGKLPNLDLNISPDALLYSVMNFCYHCWLSMKGVDVEAQRLFMANKGNVLKALLKASSQPNTAQPVTIRSTGGLEDEFDITFDNTNSTVTFGQRFYGGRQTYSYSASDVWKLSSLDVFKKNCLSAYIESAHEKGDIADLSDIDLSQLDTRDFQFDRTKISAKDVRHFAGQDRTVSLIGAEVLGDLPGQDTNYGNLKIDKKFAMQLIGSGADRRRVLDAYLQSERALHKKTPIDLVGFDLREVVLDGVDFRDINFKQVLVRKPDALVSDDERNQRFILDEQVWSWIGHLSPGQVDRPVSEKRPVPVHSSFVGLARDIDGRLSNSQPLPELLSLDVTFNNGNVQLLSKPGIRQANFHIVTRSDSVVSVQRSVFLEMLRYEDYVNFGTMWPDMAGNESGQKNQKPTEEVHRNDDVWQSDLALRFVNSLPCTVALKIELARCLTGQSNAPLNSPLQDYLIQPTGLPMHIPITLDHLIMVATS